MVPRCRIKKNAGAIVEHLDFGRDFSDRFRVSNWQHRQIRNVDDYGKEFQGAKKGHLQEEPQALRDAQPHGPAHHW